MKTGFRSREFGAVLANDRYDVGADVRAARGAALALYDVRRRKADADQRVAKAREALEHVDVSALQAELSDALANQDAIAAELKALEYTPAARRLSQAQH